jgi:hypothetical protein
MVSHSLIFFPSSSSSSSGHPHWGPIKIKQKLDQEPHKYDDKGWKVRELVSLTVFGASC